MGLSRIVEQRCNIRRLNHANLIERFAAPQKMTGKLLEQVRAAATALSANAAALEATVGALRTMLVRLLQAAPPNTTSSTREHPSTVNELLSCSQFDHADSSSAHVNMHRYRLYADHLWRSKEVRGHELYSSAQPAAVVVSGSHSMQVTYANTTLWCVCVCVTSYDRKRRRQWPSSGLPLGLTPLPPGHRSREHTPCRRYL